MNFVSSLRGSYWPTLIVSLMALSPGFVLSSSLGLLRPTIAESLDVSPDSLLWASIFGNAALALGAVLAADLAQRVGNRPLFMTYQSVFIAGSAMGLLAPNVTTLVVGHNPAGAGDRAVARRRPAAAGRWFPGLPG